MPRDHHAYPCKDDPRYAREVIDLASTDERDYWLKIIPRPMPATRKHSIEWTGELQLTITTVPLTLADVAGKTRDFEALVTRELRWLCEQHAVTLPEGTEAHGDEGRMVMLAELRKAAQAQPKPEPKPVQFVVPAEVREMSDEDLESLAPELGLREKFPKWRKMSRAEKNEAVARAQAEKGMVTA